jgi:GT2 family glycosyltransferase
VLAGEVVPDELVVVDQSDDPHPKLSAFLHPFTAIRYLWDPTPGLSRANNAGIAHARHDHLLFTHDDVRVDPAWYRQLLSALVAAGERTVVTGRVPLSVDEGGGFQMTLKDGTEPVTYRGRISADVLLPLNMGLHRSALASVGAFDERLGPGSPFPGAEDNDLGFRLLEAGYTIAYVPEAVVYHRAWRPDSDFLRLRWTYGVAQGAFYAKHLDVHDRYILGRLCADLTRHVRRIPLHLRWLNRGGLASDVIYDAGVLWGLTRWAALHHLPRWAAPFFKR